MLYHLGFHSGCLVAQMLRAECEYLPVTALMVRAKVMYRRTLYSVAVAWSVNYHCFGGMVPVNYVTLNKLKLFKPIPDAADDEGWIIQ